MSLMDKARADQRARNKEREAKKRAERKRLAAELKEDTEAAARFASEKLETEIPAGKLTAHPEPILSEDNRRTWWFTLEGLTFCVAAKRGTRKTLHVQRERPGDDDEHEWRIVRRLGDVVGT